MAQMKEDKIHPKALELQLLVAQDFVDNPDSWEYVPSPDDFGAPYYGKGEFHIYSGYSRRNQQEWYLAEVGYDQQAEEFHTIISKAMDRVEQERKDVEYQKLIYQFMATQASN